MLSELRGKQIPTDKDKNYWLEIGGKSGLKSTPYPEVNAEIEKYSGAIAKNIFETMRSYQVPFAINQQYVLETKIAKYLIDVDGTMVLFERKVLS
jgi:hypothetical protein